MGGQIDEESLHVGFIGLPQCESRDLGRIITFKKDFFGGLLSTVGYILDYIGYGSPGATGAH